MQKKLVWRHACDIVHPIETQTGSKKQPVTDRELDQFYSVNKTHITRDLIVETITKTVRTVDHRALSVPYVKNNANGSQSIDAYQLLEVVKDYGTEPKPLQALMAVLAGSDCPLVAKWREAMAQAFAEANADEVDEVINGL